MRFDGVVVDAPAFGQHAHFFLLQLFQPLRLVHLQRAVLLKPAEVGLLHDPGFLTRQSCRLAVRYGDFDLPQKVHHLLRLVLLASSYMLSLSSVSIIHWHISSGAFHLPCADYGSPSHGRLLSVPILLATDLTSTVLRPAQYAPGSLSSFAATHPAERSGKAYFYPKARSGRYRPCASRATGRALPSDATKFREKYSFRRASARRGASAIDNCRG